MNAFFDNNIPIYIQIIDDIKTKIISGELSKGDRISSVRELASEFKVNPNTVLKALTELEITGLITTESTNGKFVTSNQKVIDKYRNEYAKDIVDSYFNSMNKIGIDKEEALKYLIERK